VSRKRALILKQESERLAVTAETPEQQKADCLAGVVVFDLADRSRKSQLQAPSWDSRGFWCGP